WRNDSAQSLIETAIFLPILILLVAYAVDFGYFFIVAANLTSASRNAAEYSIQGFASPAQIALPTPGPITTDTSVAALALADLSSLVASSTTTSVEVCSKVLGTTNNVTNCSSYGPTGTVFTPATDPEAPSFVLNRVDVTYMVRPPIPLSFFSISLLPSMKFHRQVSMRVMD
ncbi:MAG TPA: TadE/TadG family type IV pilus assembly protein, partial [Acidobacteriaceae bacterium]|nr:TadE/TadG family type IV pilus assembly protein [Acidobacteriaceae bacterium]